MKKHCKEVLNHISRLEGQLHRLKVDVEKNECCETVVLLALSTAKSFDSLRAKMVEAYIQENILSDQPVSEETLKELKILYTLIKA